VSGPDDHAIVQAMIHYGGSFVSKLGEAYQAADGVNRAKIRATWPDYWTSYTELATLKAAKTCELCGEPAGPGSAICPACLEAR
jgi:hypothetical protein